VHSMQVLKSHSVWPGYIVIDKHEIARASSEKMRGFSTVELMVALAILLIVAAIAIPNLTSSMRQAHLKGAISDYASLMQQERIRAVDDDRYYSMYVVTTGGAQEGFVDIYPQNVNGASGSGGTTIDPKDPAVQINPEISEQPVGAAPNTGALKALILPANSPLTPLDGSTSTSPVTFGPRGLPCKPVAGVCDTLGGPQAYWTFFQSVVTQAWGAVTVTPSGRVQRWLYTGGTAGVWASY
jgi:prepilin-type N-terminal cleavage/methylation domain-containing protein